MNQIDDKLSRQSSDENINMTSMNQINDKISRYQSDKISI